ncbi:hypothetical protein ACJMK2_011947 [Sinanodonta woodiana]|uniref:Mab-21-like HhH/H2TH-like domain-containing protein n=1 Tax=Sinanodonta woodiana TaxID=1069815 RepID=A0ABD3V6K9_SINWO
MDIPEYYEDVSIRLTEVLDASGLGEDLRWWRINTWLQIEELEQIIPRILSNTNVKLCCFGSQTEATATHGLLSDIDNVCVICHVAVLRDLQFWEINPLIEDIFLMVTDDSTPPGYVKLQLVQNDAPILVNNYQDETICTDSEGRSVLRNTIFLHLPIEPQYHHGPASSVHYVGVTSDQVYALQAHCWPDQALEWLSSRVRRYNWPSRRMIDVIQKTGILLVPVGHKLSCEHRLEWRLSFSFGEKLLMLNMNSTQYKCYVMLKYIKNNFINANAVEHVITSYHCKTCMFYVMESTPDSLWIPNNLLFCIDMCLRLLLSWVECQNCPNYFIPEENMFLGINLGPVQVDISSILHELLRQNGRYVTRIPYENIGENVVRLCQSLPMELVDPNKTTLQTTFAHLENMLNCVSFMAATHDTINLNVYMPSHILRQEVVSIVQSLFCSGYGIHLASQSLEEDIPNQENHTMAHELLLWGTSSDVASGILKLAAYYLDRNDLSRMEEVLNHVDSKLTHTLIRGNEMFPNENTFSKMVTDKVSLLHLVRNYFAFPVIYSISDVHCIPKVLIIEIFRSAASFPVVDKLLSHWIPFVGLEPNIYLFFLQYQCYHLQRRGVMTLVALRNMTWISQADLHTLDNILAQTAKVPWRYDSYCMQLTFMAEVTTNLNLLAYCLQQSKRPMHAFKVLCKSMKMKNHHNAAMWQIATCIFSIVRPKVPQGN